MDILLTAATFLEIRPAVEFLGRQWSREGKNMYSKAGHRACILVSGIGALPTAYSLMRCFSRFSPGLAVQAGIAGSFRKDIALGTVALIEKEISGDLGMEDGEEFRDLFDSGFLREDEFPFREKMLCNDLRVVPAAFGRLPRMKGVSVNTVSGSERTIRQLERKYHPEVESMEGAAFHYVCLQEGIPFIQLRGLSNYVEIRDRSRWDIPLAVKNLNDCLVGWLAGMVD